MAKANAKQQTPHKVARLFRDRIRGSQHKWAVVADARKTLPPSTFLESLTWLLDQEGIASGLFRSRFPPHMRFVSKFAPFPPVSLVREVRWAEAFFAAHAPALQQYVSLREALVAELVQHAYTDSAAILSEVRAKFGLSYWWVKAALATKQLESGIDAQKRLASELKAEAQPDSVQAYVVHYVSVRNEPSVTPGKFVTDMRESIRQLKLSEDWQYLLQHHIVGPWPTTLAQSQTFLWHSAAASLIDYYEAFIHVARVAVASSLAEKQADSIEKSTQALAAVLHDPRLERLACLFPDSTADSLEAPVADDWASLVAGDVSKATALANLAHHTSPERLAPFIVASRDEDAAAEGSMLGSLAHCLRIVTAKTHDTEAAAGEIDRAALNQSAVEVTGALQAIARIEMSPRLFRAPRSTLLSEGDTELAGLRYSLATSISAHPSLLRFADGRLRNILEARIRNVEPVPAIEAFMRAANGDVGSTSTPELLLAATEHRLANEDFEGALSSAEQLIATGEPLYDALGAKYLALALMYSGRIVECVRFVASSVIRNEEMRSSLPVRDLVDRLDRHTRRTLRGELAVAILFDLYGRFVDGAYEAIRRRATAEALNALGVSKPTQLRDRTLSVDTEELVYFLWRVCSPDALYLAGSYGGTRALQEERVGILEWLKILDPEAEPLYQAELVGLTRQMVLHARRTRIEQSKIQLDLERYRRDAENSVGDSYSRYIAFRKAGVTAAGSQLDAAARSHEVEQRGDAPSLPAALPTDEARVLFAGICEDLVTHFIGDRYHGLDGSLSSRIRHGILENELRSPLVALGLVTDLDETTGAYKPNERWLAPIRESASLLADPIDERLARFSAAYDALIQEINSVWLHVSRRAEETGMIHVRLRPEQLAFLDSLYTELAALDPPFFTLADAVFHTLTQGLEPTLAAVSARLLDEGLNRATSLIVDLERQIDSLRVTDSVAGLMDAIRSSSVGVQRSFERVAQWFALSYRAIDEAMPLNDVVDLCVEMARSLFPGFNATVALHECADVVVPGAFVMAYTDIFVTLFGNIAKHSSLSGRPSVSIVAELVDDAIEIRLSNSLGEGANRELISERVESRLAAIRDASYLRSGSPEGGGTGLWRVHHMIRTALQLDPRLAAGIDASDVFVVSFCLPRS